MSTGLTFVIFVVAIIPPMNFQPLLKSTYCFFRVHLLTVGSLTSFTTSDYELSEQEIHHEIEWFFTTTFKCTGTSPYRGTGESVEHDTIGAFRLSSFVLPFGGVLTDSAQAPRSILLCLFHAFPHISRAGRGRGRKRGAFFVRCLLSPSRFLRFLARPQNS